MSRPKKNGELEFPVNDLEFHQAWWHCAGAIRGLNYAVAAIMERATEAFRDGRDETANALRDAARMMVARSERERSDLTAYIAEDERRQRAAAKEFSEKEHEQ